MAIANVIAGISSLLAGWVASKVGLVNTMVRTSYDCIHTHTGTQTHTHTGTHKCHTQRLDLLTWRVCVCVCLCVCVLYQVLTHLPSNILLMLVPVMPTLELATIMLFLRYSISQMDVAPRQSYVSGNP